jgi:hypothetical protein
MYFSGYGPNERFWLGPAPNETFVTFNTQIIRLGGWDLGHESCTVVISRLICDIAIIAHYVAELREVG